jgi:hypothetical protein
VNNTFIYLVDENQIVGEMGQMPGCLWLWAKIPGWLGIFHFKSKMR